MRPHLSNIYCIIYSVPLVHRNTYKPGLVSDSLTLGDTFKAAGSGAAWQTSPLPLSLSLGEGPIDHWVETRIPGAEGAMLMHGHNLDCPGWVLALLGWSGGGGGAGRAYLQQLDKAARSWIFLGLGCRVVESREWIARGSVSLLDGCMRQ